MKRKFKFSVREIVILPKFYNNEKAIIAEVRCTFDKNAKPYFYYGIDVIIIKHGILFLNDRFYIKEKELRKCPEQEIKMNKIWNKIK